MTHQDEPCLNCRMPVVRAATEKGLPLSLEIDPTLDGAWKLRERHGDRPLASKPSARLAFGVKLYTEHVCKRAWGKK